MTKTQAIKLIRTSHRVEGGESYCCCEGSTFDKPCWVEIIHPNNWVKNTRKQIVNKVKNCDEVRCKDGILEVEYKGYMLGRYKVWSKMEYGIKKVKIRRKSCIK